MFWVILWAGLLLGAGVVLGLLGRALWRRGRTLGTELARAGNRMAAAGAALGERFDQAP